LCLCGESRAGLDPEVSKPYELRVVLDIAENRLLTKVFQERVERELRDGLQAAFGSAAIVQVVRDHPRLKDVRRNGLQSLGSWTDLDGVKTHFVLIDYVNGEYDIQARQHDGLTGLASPVVRRERLPDSDRQLVARAAAQMVGLDDFGPVGTITEKSGDTGVTLTLKASQLPGQPGRPVKKGDVFWLVRIRQGAGGLRGEKVPWALLQVQKDPESGICPCAVYHRLLGDPVAEGAGVLGYRCLGLDTITAPLRIQLVQPGARVKTPMNEQVHVRQHGFTGEDTTQRQGITDPDGFFSTEKDGEAGLFHNIAFVTVGSEARRLARIPVELVDERTVVIPVTITADPKQDAAERAAEWEKHVLESLQSVAQLFQDLEGMLKDKQPQDALKRAQAGLPSVHEDIVRYEEQRQGLKAAESQGTRVNLSRGDGYLKQLRDGEVKLQDFVARLEKRLKEENDPKRRELQDKVARAQLLEDEANYDKALEVYKEVLDSGVDVPQVRERYEKLKKEWDPKSPEDRQARQFIYDVFPQAEPEKLKDYLRRAETAYQTCHQTGDVLALRKLFKVAVEHAGRLKKVADTLQPDNSAEDRDKATAIAEASDGLQRLIGEVTAAVEKKAAPAPAK
jgi:hypothetical protein